MIILDATTRKMQVKLTGAVTLNQLPVIASYVDITSTAITPITNTTQTNSTTEVDFIAAPLSSTQRQVKYISIQNQDTMAATVVVIFNDNSTQRQIGKWTLQVNETLEYVDTHGWKVIDAQGRVKTALSAFAENIEDAVTDGVTDKAPSENAVYDQLLLHRSAREGMLLNGRIAVTVAASNLTVAVKTFAGTDPAAADPVWVVIDGVVRQITAALSMTLNAGTNWFNAGSAELATYEVDYFTYLGWNAANSVVVLGCSRIVGNIRSDFSQTSTNNKYLHEHYTTGAVATDKYSCIGRFAATLSAGAGYTWTVPAFDGANLIQFPIYETRILSADPNAVGFSSFTKETLKYKVRRDMVTLFPDISGTSSTTAFTYSIPFDNPGASVFMFTVQRAVNNGGGVYAFFRINGSTNTVQGWTSAIAGVWLAAGTKALELTVLEFYL